MSVTLTSYCQLTPTNAHFLQPADANKRSLPKVAAVASLLCAASASPLPHHGFGYGGHGFRGYGLDFRGHGYGYGPYRHGFGGHSIEHGFGGYGSFEHFGWDD
ncbi:hypothetical protein HAZT_HAZT009766 [Hyalella azteca]|uniref:Uncharacterized protein n=1 Tax=Hyalella azteca TaxID=294128 RepID=A0A6A0GSI7_HYAAZ|nr:hypothetical protein HAZT_HAZT009766 [Hyalella azteca]